MPCEASTHVEQPNCKDGDTQEIEIGIERIKTESVSMHASELIHKALFVKIHTGEVTGCEFVSDADFQQQEALASDTAECDKLDEQGYIGHAVTQIMVRKTHTCQ